MVFFYSEISEQYHFCPHGKSGCHCFPYRYISHQQSGHIFKGEVENHQCENYLEDVRESDDVPSSKTELSKKVNRSGTVYDPPPPIKAFVVDVGQGNGAINELSSGEL